MSHSAQSHRVAFTLIEILLALGVLAMVVALVGPALFEQIAPRSFEYTSDRLASEIRLAREDARRTGEITLVYATADDESGRVRVETRLRPPETGVVNGVTPGFDADAATPAPPGSDSGSSRLFPRADASAASGSLRETNDGRRLLFQLPEGCRIVFEPPASLTREPGFGDTASGEAFDEIGGVSPDPGGKGGPDRDSSFQFQFEPGEGEGYGTDDSPRLIAVCVPDGTVLPAGPAWLVDAENRAARLIIDPASGVIVCQRVVRPREDRMGVDDLIGEGVDGSGEFPDERARRDRIPGDRQGRRVGVGPTTGGPP